MPPRPESMRVAGKDLTIWSVPTSEPRVSLEGQSKGISTRPRAASQKKVVKLNTQRACRWRCLSRWVCPRALRGQGACGRDALCRRCGRAQVHALRRHRRNAYASRGPAGRARSLLRRPHPAETDITAMVGSRFDFGFTIGARHPTIQFAVGKPRSFQQQFFRTR